MPRGKKFDPVAVERGQRLRSTRERVGMTQQQVSAATGWTDIPGSPGLSPSRIANYEQGTRRIDVEEAEVLASVFHAYPAAYFLCVVDEQEAKMLQLMRHKTPHPCRAA